MSIERKSESVRNCREADDIWRNLPTSGTAGEPDRTPVTCPITCSVTPPFTVELVYT